MSDSADCSIMIATHNRCSELEKTMQELQRLTPAPAEILVCLDACTDGSEAMLKAKFPDVITIKNRQPLGSIGSRNRLLRAANSPFVLSLDDDSYPVESDFLSFALKEFMQYPRLAILVFPQRSEEFPDSLVEKDFGASQFQGSYSSSGAMLRRHTYLQQQGYPSFFFHAYEEPDYALQCFAAGWQVKFCPLRTIRHRYTSIGRNEIRIHHRHARNELLSVVMRCPLPYALGVGLFRLLRQFGYACSRGASWVIREPVWWLNFLKLLPQAIAQRSPLPWRTYRGWMQLLRRPVTTESEWLQLAGISAHNRKQ